MALTRPLTWLKLHPKFGEKNKNQKWGAPTTGTGNLPRLLLVFFSLPRGTALLPSLLGAQMCACLGASWDSLNLARNIDANQTGSGFVIR